MKKIRYFSLFSGIGGFELGINQSNEINTKHAPFSKKSKQEERTQRRVRSTNKHGTLLHTRNRTTSLCVGHSEIDKYATEIYQKHFPTHKNYGDITKIKTKELPDFDLLVGGFPCQSFSIAGKRRGFDDTRGTLFFEIARIIRDKKPKYFVLENVKGLLSHNIGRTFGTILITLDELGYDIQWQVLNSKNHGVPQNRERVFIVGHIRGSSRPKVFPITTDDRSPDDLHRHISNTLTTRYEKGQATRTYIGESKRNAQKTNRPSVFKKRNEPNNSDQRGGSTHTTDIRRLTPTECERLQGFPDGWTLGVSDTQRYKMLGNAVTTNVVGAIMKKLL